MIAMPIPASPQNSSSLTIGRPSPVGSAKNWARPSKPYSPIFAASWMIGHGVSSRSSHSWAAGRITSAAKPCTQSRMSFWSWVSCSEKVTSWPAAPVIASTAASAAWVDSGVATGGADIEVDLLWAVIDAVAVGYSRRIGYEWYPTGSAHPRQ